MRKITIEIDEDGKYSIRFSCTGVEDALACAANMIAMSTPEIPKAPVVKGNGTAAGTILKIMQTGKKGAEWSTRDLESALSMTKYKGYERKNISAQLGWMAKSGKVKRVGDKPARYTAV